MGTFELQNEQLRVSVRSLGAELVSVRRGDLEYLWNGDPAYWARTSPVLFPFVGKCRDGRYRTEGTEFGMGQHGFARDMEFSLVSQTSTELWFLLESNQETYGIYPYTFRLHIGYQLKEDRVRVLWRVENTNDRQMYFAIGAHPAFRCPLEKEYDQSDCFLQFDSPFICYHHINRDGMCTREDYNLPLKDRCYQILPTTFDDDALIVEGRQARQVALLRPDHTPYVTMTFDAPLFGLWSPARKQAPFVCIEPWYGRCDSFDFEGELKDREYENSLDPREEFQAAYEMQFS